MPNRELPCTKGLSGKSWRGVCDLEGQWIIIRMMISLSAFEFLVSSMEARYALRRPFAMGCTSTVDNRRRSPKTPEPPGVVMIGLVAMPAEALAAGHAAVGGDAHFKENGYRQNERNGGQHSDTGRCSTGRLWDAPSSLWPMPVPVSVSVAWDCLAVLRMGYWNSR